MRVLRKIAWGRRRAGRGTGQSAIPGARCQWGGRAGTPVVGGRVAPSCPGHPRPSMEVRRGLTRTYLHPVRRDRGRSHAGRRQPLSPIPCAHRRRVLVLRLLVVLAGCGSRTAPPPEPGTQRGMPPDLRGRTAMVLPVQQDLGVPGDLDAELLFGLRSRGADIAWVEPEALDRALRRSPSLSARTRGLPVGQFLAAEVLRIGDPPFGELFRLSSLVNAQAAVLPMQGVLVQEIDDPAPRVRMTVALIETR